MNPAIGECPCPFCQKAATVHRAKGKHSQPLYLRCGTVFAGPNSDGCGVNQCRGPSAQAWIMKNAKFYESGDREKLAVATAPVAAEAVAEVVENARELRKQQQEVRQEQAPTPEPKQEPKKQGSSWTIL